MELVRFPPFKSEREPMIEKEEDSRRLPCDFSNASQIQLTTVILVAS